MVYLKKCDKTHREEEVSFIQSLLQMSKTWSDRDKGKRGMGRRRTDDETALTVSDQMLDGNYCESGRVTCEASARVVRYYSPPTGSLRVCSLFTFFHDSLFIFPVTSNSKYAEYSPIKHTPIFLVKSEKHIP